MSAGKAPRGTAPARREAIQQSRRLTEETRNESRPGSGSRKDGMSDRLSRISTDRDTVNRLGRLYCELGTVTFDHVDGRLLSHQYHARRAALCAEIRRQLVGLGTLKGTERR